MKTSCFLVKALILFLLLMVFPFSNLYPQYFVDQSKIDELKISKQKYYLAPESKSKDKDIYLRQMDSHGYYSDAKIGFDKEIYKNGEPVILTLRRGNENKEERVRIIISGSFDVSSDQIKIDNNDGVYGFYLKKGDNIKIKLNTTPTNGDCLIISLSAVNLDKSPFAREYRVYYIIYDRLNKSKIEKEEAERKRAKEFIIRHSKLPEN